jgi:hypothetical protein
MCDDVLADLEELYHRRVARDGAGKARRWYRVQVLSYVVRFGTERVRGSARTAGRGSSRDKRDVVS